VTLPRQVLPGTTYLVTRRVSQRQFLLKPSAVTRQVVLYCFHRAAQKYDIELHALETLDNHYHAVVTDTRGNLPDFMAWVHREIAKCLNEIYGRSENLFSDDKYSAVVLIDRESVLDKLVYTFVNVVAARLVRHYRDWHGVRSTPQDWLRPPDSVKRPDFHFGQSDERWAEVECRYTVPPQLRDSEAEQLVGELDRMIAERERSIRAEAARAGKTFVGEQRLLKLDPFDSPKTPHRKGKLNPRFAAGTAEGQERGRQMLRAFRSAYREAFEKWRNGVRSTFPAGTFGLIRLARVLCARLETAQPALDSG
jgi:putative transposase